MAHRDLERIRRAFREARYTLTEHAYDELDEDRLDILDIVAAILTGEIDAVLTMDPRGNRYVIIGCATDQTTRVAIVCSFIERDELLVLTVYVPD